MVDAFPHLKATTINQSMKNSNLPTTIHSIQRSVHTAQAFPHLKVKTINQSQSRIPTLIYILKQTYLSNQSIEKPDPTLQDGWTFLHLKAKEFNQSRRPNRPTR